MSNKITVSLVKYNYALVGLVLNTLESKTDPMDGLYSSTFSSGCPSARKVK